MIVKEKHRFFQIMQIVNKVFALLIGAAGVIGGFTAGSVVGFFTAAGCIGLGLFLLTATELMDVLMAIEENTRLLLQNNQKNPWH